MSLQSGLVKSTPSCSLLFPSMPKPCSCAEEEKWASSKPFQFEEENLISTCVCSFEMTLVTLSHPLKNYRYNFSAQDTWEKKSGIVKRCSHQRCSHLTISKTPEHQAVQFQNTKWHSYSSTLTCLCCNSNWITNEWMKTSPVFISV